MEKVSSFSVTEMAKHNDPFDFIIDLCQISPSQEELLRHQLFVGETVDQPSPSPSAAAGILMMSMPQTQYPTEKDASAPKDQDVFLTPLEKSLSLPISSDDPFDNVPQFVDLRGDSDATVYVDLGRDSDLGFSDVQLTQVVHEELIDGNSSGAKRVVVGDKFKGFERELDSNEKISESAMKRLKLSDPKSGFDSPMVCLGIQSQKGKDQFGSEAKTHFCNVEKGSEKNNSKISCVFDVLKFLSENCNDDDDEEDGVENLSLLEAFKKGGLSFPRPRWWPENDRFRRERIL
ncbi:hypothetical protein TanjilG_09982 [Lupinus angustifolius]|uniref:Uncharacterized protein n=1 Tax=Lupinus angustifolius TaxID=3871 RepID=A0A1J7GQL3_LUPAN|nr:hypothetical protein TanjilG_09982 [Lupinus angustifolius]